MNGPQHPDPPGRSPWARPHRTNPPRGGQDSGDADDAHGPTRSRGSHGSADPNERTVPAPGRRRFGKHQHKAPAPMQPPTPAQSRPPQPRPAAHPRPATAPRAGHSPGRSPGHSRRGAQPAPAGPPAAKPDAKPHHLRWLMIGTGALALITLAVVAALTMDSFAGAELNVHDAQVGVQQVLSDPINGYGRNDVSNVRCNNGKNPAVKRGATFTCLVNVGGADRRVTVLFTDNDGTYEVDQPR